MSDTGSPLESFLYYHIVLIVLNRLHFHVNVNTILSGILIVIALNIWSNIGTNDFIMFISSSQ